jgi:hypothetical protein
VLAVRASLLLEVQKLNNKKMEALVLLLKNTKDNTYHPIMYFESFFAGGYESEINQKIIRYKSKGHRTNGFSDRKEAIASIDSEIAGKLKEMGYNLNRELDGDLEWDGIDIPADVQLRSRVLA